MENNEKDPTENETVLMALDQISQTIDVMNSIVGRLRTYVEQQQSGHNDPASQLGAERDGDHILH